MTGACRCPTCRSPWRGAANCPRCDADLGGVMRLAARAWELREAARAALCAGDRPAEALWLALEARRLHDTPRGRRLLALALLTSGRRAEATWWVGRIFGAGAAAAATEPTGSM